MTLPTNISIGTGSETSAAWGTHAANDVGILIVSTGSGTVTTPAGWTIIEGLSSIAHPTGSITIAGFYKIAASSSESPAALAGGSSYLWGTIAVYRGVNLSNPIHVCSPGIGFSSLSHNAPGFTTYLPDCMLVGAVSYGADAASIVSSGLTNAGIGSLTERYTPTGTTTGNGGGVYIFDGTLALKATIIQTEWSFGSSSGTVTALIALQAADKTFGQKTRTINLGGNRMAVPVQQSTASEFTVFAADSSDGKSGKTGLTLAVTLKKFGETSYSSISPTVTELASGNYLLNTLTTTHNNTVGPESLRATAAGADAIDAPNFQDIVAYDKTSATRGTAGTALPAVAAEAAGGLYTRGTGAGQIKQSENGQVDANLATWNLSGTSASTTVPKAMTAAGLVQASDGSGNAIAPASATTAIQAKTDNLPSDPADASDIAAAFGTVNATLATIASYIDTEVATLVAGLALVKAKTDNLPTDPADASDIAALFATAAATEALIKAKTDQLTFTVANQVDANALTGGGGATADDVRDAVLDYEYRTGRTLRGLFRRLGAALEKATGLKGTLVQYFQPDGATLEFSVAQSTTNGTREVGTVTNSETP